MTRRPCECGRIDGQGDECDRPLGRLRDVVWVTIVPESERGSARASGAYTYYGGLEHHAVSRACWRSWVRDYVAADDQDYVRTTITIAEHRCEMARLARLRAGGDA